MNKIMNKMKVIPVFFLILFLFVPRVFLSLVLGRRR